MSLFEQLHQNAEAECENLSTLHDSLSCRITFCHDYTWLCCCCGFRALGGAEQGFQEVRGGVWIAPAFTPVPRLSSSRHSLKTVELQENPSLCQIVSLHQW